MNDLIRLAAERAAASYGGHDGTFNAANFSQEFIAMGPTVRQIDGIVVRMMLTGRDDIGVLAGGSHYRLRAQERKEP